MILADDIDVAAPIVSDAAMQLREQILVPVVSQLGGSFEAFNDIAALSGQIISVGAAALSQLVAGISAITGFYNSIATSIEKNRVKSLENQYEQQDILFANAKGAFPRIVPDAKNYDRLVNRPWQFYGIPNGALSDKEMYDALGPEKILAFQIGATESIVKNRRTKAKLVGKETVLDVAREQYIAGAAFRNKNFGRDKVTRSWQKMFTGGTFADVDDLTQRIWTKLSPEARGRVSTWSEFSWAGWGGGVIMPSEIWSLCKFTYPWCAPNYSPHPEACTPSAIGFRFLYLAPTSLHCSVHVNEVGYHLRNVLDRIGNYGDLPMLPDKQVDSWDGVDRDGVPYQTSPSAQKPYYQIDYWPARDLVRDFYTFLEVRRAVLREPEKWSDGMKQAALDSGDPLLIRAAKGEKVYAPWSRTDPLEYRKKIGLGVGEELAPDQHDKPPGFALDSFELEAVEPEPPRPQGPGKLASSPTQPEPDERPASNQINAAPLAISGTAAAAAAYGISRSRMDTTSKIVAGAVTAVAILGAGLFLATREPSRRDCNIKLAQLTDQQVALQSYDLILKGIPAASFAVRLLGEFDCEGLAIPYVKSDNPNATPEDEYTNVEAIRYAVLPGVAASLERAKDTNKITDEQARDIARNVLDWSVDAFNASEIADDVQTGWIQDSGIDDFLTPVGTPETGGGARPGGIKGIRA